jgi:protein-tyrosine-phosphatase
MSETAPIAKWLKTIARRIVPQSLLKQREIIIRLGQGAGGIYTRMRILSAIGMNQTNKRLAPENARSFVFVCFGNIMRSPMADALLKEAAAKAKVDMRSDSAGLHAIPGNQAHAWALTAAYELGISLASHRAKLLSSEMVEQADAVFAMDLQNLAEMLNLYPEFKNKFFMLSAYAGKQHRIAEIPDPYFGDLDTTRRCYGVLKTCIANLIASRPAQIRSS